MPVSPVTLDEIVGLQRYEEIRADVRRRIIELKKRRRVSVGDRVTFVFENHDTVWFQIQEMLRAEHIVDLDRVREEIAVYNELIPRAGELSATMFLEITDLANIREELLRFRGIDECVTLELGHLRLQGIFEPGRSKEDKLSAVQYVRFACPSDAAGLLRQIDVPARLVVSHPNYTATADLPVMVRESLAEDLQ
ncbi:MAG: DUF3501 family protein [Candidatus Binatia bacterium]|nr:DUF3501 family protein [Candidatus Binatia bacterium]